MWITPYYLYSLEIEGVSSGWGWHNAFSWPTQALQNDFNKFYWLIAWKILDIKVRFFIRYVYRASLGRRDELITAQVTTSSPSLCARVLDQPVSPYQRWRMHFLVRISIRKGKIKLCSERKGESARWADLTILSHQNPCYDLSIAYAVHVGPEIKYAETSWKQKDGWSFHGCKYNCYMPSWKNTSGIPVRIYWYNSL